MFRKSQCGLTGKNNLKKTLMDEAGNLTNDYDIPDCHNLKNKLLSKFIMLACSFTVNKLIKTQKKQTGKKEYRT